MYVFVSIASLATRKAIGACIIKLEIDDPKDGKEAKEKVNNRLSELGFLPKEPHQILVNGLYDETWENEGMELDRWYTREEMATLGNIPRKG